MRKVAVGFGLVAVLLAGSRLIPAGAQPARGKDDPKPAADGPQGSPGAVSGYRSASAGGSLVHVAGAVRHPGVYRVGADARVRDAVRRAGGASRSADLNLVNLAARVTDGQQVVVPRRPPAVTAGSSIPGEGDAQRGPVSLASATVEQLDALDGVGPAIAQKIVDWRTKHGAFSSVDDLDQVPGIGPGKLEALRGQLTP